MVAFNKFEIFVEDVAEGIHDLDTDTLELALSNVAPVVTNTLLANITEIVYTNLDARTLTLFSSDSATSTYKIEITDKVLTASGAVPTFRYVVVFNQGTVGKVNPLIAWYDHGSGVTLANGETFTVDFDDANGFFQISQS